MKRKMFKTIIVAGAVAMICACGDNATLDKATDPVGNNPGTGEIDNPINSSDATPASSDAVPGSSGSVNPGSSGTVNPGSSANPDNPTSSNAVPGSSGSVVPGSSADVVLRPNIPRTLALRQSVAGIPAIGTPASRTAPGLRKARMIKLAQA